MTKCRHKWKDLYQNPGDSGFKAVYTAQELDAFKECQACGAVGKRNDQGSILQLPPKKWEGHRTRAAIWQQNLETFAIAQEQS